MVYAGNKVVLKSGPMMDLNSVWMVRSLSNLDDDSARPVPYLKWSGPVTDSNSVWMVRSQSNLDDDSARPVPYLK